MIKQEDINKLISLERVYNTGKNIIDDSEYEALFVHIMNKYNITDRNILISRIQKNAIMKHSGYVSHLTFIKKIRKFYNAIEIYKHIMKYSHYVYNSEHNERYVIIEPKIDGIMVSVIFLNGLLVKCITRGNKYSGEDITNVVKHIVHNMEVFDNDRIYEISCELFMKFNIYTKYYKQFRTSRHAMLSIITNINSTKEDYSRLSLFVHGCGDHLYSVFKTYTYLYEVIVNTNKIGENTHTIININNIVTDLENIYTQFYNTYICIDGVIIKFIQLNEPLYNSHKELNDSVVAYKKIIHMKTTILSLEYSYTKVGNIIPQAIIDTVEYNGIVCNRISLYSYSFIKSRGIGINDTINVIFGGIFVFDSVLSSANNFVEITICQYCNTALQIVGMHIRCINYNCPDKLKKHITYFCKCLRIVGISLSTVNTLVNEKIICNIIDFFELRNKHDKMVNIKGFGTKKIDNILASIEYIKNNITNIHIINILPIDSIGTKTALLLSNVIFSDQFNIDTCTFLNKLQKKQLKIFFNDNNNKKLILYFSNLKKQT